MKIIATDGYTLHGGDLSWEKISSLGELVVYDRTPPELIIERCEDADIILTNKDPFDENRLSSLPKLKLISVTATGYNIIDVIAAKKHGVVVCNVPAYGTDSVAQHTFALLLEMTNHVGKNMQSTARGEWEKAEDWSYTKAPITELAGKTIGIVGFGHIGQQTARIAKAFGMNVVYYTPHKKQTTLAHYSDLKNLFSTSDFVSLHCPLTPENKEFVNMALLKKMKRSAVIINTARGQLINEQDLTNALNQDIIAGAALDVLSKEPPLSTNPLLKAKNCVITPHNAWISREARSRIMDITAENIEGFLKNNPVNIVS